MCFRFLNNDPLWSWLIHLCWNVPWWHLILDMTIVLNLSIVFHRSFISLSKFLICHSPIRKQNWMLLFQSIRVKLNGEVFRSFLSLFNAEIRHSYLMVLLKLFVRLLNFFRKQTLFCIYFVVLSRALWLWLRVIRRIHLCLVHRRIHLQIAGSCLLVKNSLILWLCPWGAMGFEDIVLRGRRYKVIIDHFTMR